MQKILVITYYWPPGSGAGVQRWLKFSKYLPSFGWEPVIITVDPEYASYPATDPTLEEDIPAGVRVYKTRAIDYFRFYKKDKSRVPSAGFANSDEKSFTSKFMRFIRGNFFIPDPRRGWNKYAFATACELIKKEGIKVVVTTSPPHSTQLIGLKLKRRFPEIKWIADLRDPWTGIYYYSMFFHTFLARTIDSKYEKMVLREADKVITVGRSLRDHFISRVPAIADKTGVITNGYDEDDFKDVPSVDPEVFTISYIGTLSESYPLKGFLEAVSMVRNEGLRVKLRFAGHISPGQKELIIRKTGEEDSEFINYVDHKTAIRYMRSSSMLLLIIPDHTSSGSIITGKLFEYLASGKPVICLGPVDGDAAEIIKESGAGSTSLFNDSEKIYSIIKSYRNNNSECNKDNLSYSRRSLTEDLSALISK